MFLLNQLAEYTSHCYKPKVHGVFMVSADTSTSDSSSCSSSYCAPFEMKKNILHLLLLQV